MESIKELAERVSIASKLLFEHRRAALNGTSRTFSKEYQVENYLWEALNKIGIDNSELGFRLIKTRLALLQNFNAKCLNRVWYKLVLDILRYGSIQWPHNRGIGG